MTFSYFRKRFHEMMFAYVGTNIHMFKKLYYLLDYLFSYIIHGASISDYFAFGFYDLRYSGRKKFITYRRYLQIQKKCNDKDEIRICRSKLEFNRYFKDFIGREWIDVESCSFDEFDAFLNVHRTFFVKEINGFRGTGVRKILSDEVDNREFFESLKKRTGEHFILEEEISQISELNDFHPWSINTLRIVTLYDEKNDIVHIMNARLRIGNNKNNVDNLHYAGIGANIDIPTGIINSPGRDAKNHLYIVHPLTRKQIVGFKIPYWKECLDYVDKVARNLPKVRYVGWDIVIKENGTFILIEANDNADHDFQQLFCGGLWSQYKKIM